MSSHARIPPRPGQALAISAVALALVLATGAAAEPPHEPGLPHLLPGDGGSFPALGDQTSPAIVAGAGGFLAVWTDERSTVLADGGTGKDVYAARLAADGSLIDEVPIIITRAPGDQYDPLAVWNGTGWLVVWTGSVDGYPIPHHNTEGTRLSAAGEVLDPMPFEIWAYGSGDEHIVGAASDGQDWVVVMTDVYPSGLGTKTRLVAIKVTAAGDVLGSQIIYSPSCCSFFYHTGMAYADGTYMVVFEGYVDSFNYGIFGLRMTPSLSLLDSYPLTLVQIAMQAETHFYRTPTVTSDGQDFYVAWQLWLNDVSSQIYGAIVTPAGTSLNGDGVPISNVLPASLDLQPSAAWDGTQWVVGWEQSGQAQLARVDAAGTVVDPGGVATGLPPDLAFTGNGNGLQLAWDELRHAGSQPYDVLAARTSTGLNLEPEAVISLGAPMQLEADIARGDQGALVVHASRTADGSRILAQPLDDVGVAVLAEPIELASGEVGHPGVAWDGQQYMVVWEDASAIRGVRVSSSGSVLDGTPLSILGGVSPAVAAAAGGFLTVAIDGGAARAARVAPDGTLLDTTPLTLGAGPAQDVDVASIGSLWFATWERIGAPDGGDIEMSGVDGGGTVFGPLAITTAGDGIAARRPAIAGGDSALIVWQDDRGGDLDLYGRRFSSSLTFNDPAAGLALITSGGDQQDAAVAWDGVRFVLVFADTRDRMPSLEEYLAVYRGWAPAVGAIAEPAGLELFTGDVSAGEPAVTGADDRQVYVASVFQPAQPFAAYRLEVRFAGLPTAAGAVPAVTRLVSTYPNPANPAVTIRFSLAREGRATIDIYDTRGARLRSLRVSGLSAGDHELVWNGTDERGRPLPSGTYLFRLQAGGVSQAGKISLVR
jgi:hypothetical protein